MIYSTREVGQRQHNVSFKGEGAHNSWPHKWLRPERDRSSRGSSGEPILTGDPLCSPGEGEEKKKKDEPSCNAGGENKRGNGKSSELKIGGWERAGRVQAF